MFGFAVLGLIFRSLVSPSDTNTGWWNVHDFIAAEMGRLVRAKAGALVLTTLAGCLIAAKSHVSTSEGMVPAAELSSSMFHLCPGLLRSVEMMS